MRDRDDTTTTISTRALSLDTLAKQIDEIEGVWKKSLQWGDRVVVVTRNSTYVLQCLGGGDFAVTGGWFERHSDGERVVRVNGCTWGGRAINEDMVAAPGLFLEFGNGVQTTRIRSVEVFRHAEDSAPN